MKNMKSFREEKKDSNLRKDTDEGLLFNYLPSYSKLIIGGKEIEPSDLVGSAKFTENRILHQPIYCMSALYCSGETIAESDVRISERVKGFGDYFLLITNVSEFLSRVDNILKFKNISYSRGLVEYKDLKSLHGRCNPFIKDKKFEFQKEYRIVLNTYSDKPYELDIGNLEDISFLGKTKDFNRLIKIQVK